MNRRIMRLRAPPLFYYLFPCKRPKGSQHYEDPHGLMTPHGLRHTHTPIECYRSHPQMEQNTLWETLLVLEPKGTHRVTE